MTFFAFAGAVQLGLVYAVMALGVFLTFRALDFPDLSVDGSFPLGAAVSAVLITKGVNPYLTLLAATAAGALAGAVTAVLNTKFKILNLLSGILTMIALYSINIRIMGMPNTSLLGYETVFTPFIDMGYSASAVATVFFAVIAFAVSLLLIWFFHTDLGLALRATGDNDKMVKAQGANTDRIIILGVALSNALVALSGGLVGQVQEFADVNMGIGIVVAGLATVILGEAIISSTTVFKAVISVIIGSVVYRLAIALALSFHIGSFEFSPSDLNLITAVLVVVALMFPGIRKKIGVIKK